MSPIAMDFWLNMFFTPKNADRVINENGGKEYDALIVCYLYKDPLGGHYFFAENDGLGNYYVYNDPSFKDPVSQKI